MNQHLRKKARLTSFLRKALKPFFAICALAPVFAIHTASAQTLYWTPGGGAAGGSGNWDITTSNWSTTSGGATTQTWTQTSTTGGTAIFNGTAANSGTVTVQVAGGGTGGFINASGITFLTGNNLNSGFYYNITDDGATTLQLVGAANANAGGASVAVVTVGTGIVAAFTTSLAATAPVYFTGAGSIYLNANEAAPTFGNPIASMTITGGATVVAINASTPLPLAVVTVGVATGGVLTGSLTGAGTLDVFGNSLSINTLAGAPNGIVMNSGGFGPTDAILTLTGAAGGSTTFAGQITDTIGASASHATIVTTLNTSPGVGVLGLTINGAYTLNLSGTSNYNGMTVVGDGTNATVLQAGANGAFSKYSAVEVLASATLDLNSFSETIAALNGVTGDTGIVANRAALTTSILTLNGDGGSDTLTNYASIVGVSFNSNFGTLGLVKNGAYTQVLAGTDSYTGTTTVNTGVLAAGSLAAFSPNSDVTVAAGGILDLNGFSNTIGSLSGSGAVVNGSGLVTGATTGKATLTTGFDGATTTFTGTIDNGTSGALTLTKVGSGTFTITNSANTYSGGTNIAAGTLSFSSGALSTGLVTFTGTSTLLWNGTNTQDISTINGLTINNGVTATINTNGNNVTFATELDGGTPTTGALTKTGSGTLTLAHLNNYTGGTNLNEGTVSFVTGGLSTGPVTFTGNSTLQWNGTNTQDISANGVTINAGITGTFDTNGNNVTLASSLTTGAGAGVTKVGAGVLTLGGTNTYTGATTVTGGTLKAGTATGFSASSAFTVNTPGILDVNGLAPKIGSLTGAGTVTNSNAAAGTLITGNDNTSTTFSGLIQNGTGTTALTKIGTGTFTLTTANTYGGGTNLQNGTLVVANSNALGVGNVTVSGGALQAGGSNMNINVGGNYTQTAGELDLRIGGTTTGTHDQLTVTGSATVNGKLSLTAVNGYAPKNGDVIPIVTAGGGVSGLFAPVTGGLASYPLVKLTVRYLPNQVDLDFTQGSFMAAAALLHQTLTPNERAVATALDNVSTNAASAKLLSYLDALPFNSLPAAYDRIAPAEYGAIFEISRSVAKIEAASIENRLDEVHAGAAPAGATGPAGPEDYKGSKEVLPPPDKRLSVFANGSGEFVNVGDSYNAKGYDFDSGAATVGVDYRFTDHFLAGVLLNYTGTEADLTNGGRIDANAFRGGVYATVFGGGAYVNAFAGGAYSSYNLDREGLNSTVRGNTDGSDFNGLITTGYDVHAGGFTYGPVASFQYTYTGLNGFNETGSLVPLHIQSGSGQSILSNVGARAAYDWHIGSMVLVPEVRATWQHEYGDDTDAITADMLLGSPVFRVTTSPLGRDSLVLNAGFTLKITADISAYAFYDGELARTNYQANNVMVGFRTSF